MLGVFSGIKSVIPIGKKVGSAKTEGPVCQLHYRATTLIFLSCCVLVTSLEWVGNGANITCAMVGPDDTWTVSKEVINSYCYIQSTFTVPSQGSQAHPGVGPLKRGKEVQYKAYYQWVSFLLFLQAGLFYFPHLLYKNWEGGKLSNIISGLHTIVLDKDDRQSREKILARYLCDTLHHHNGWAVRLFLARCLYLVNLLLNMIIIDIFLDWEFSTYGMQVVDLMVDDPPGRVDPMARIFPKVTKCSMRKYGPTGTIQVHDAMCILPINIINEKIYVVLWFWLTGLCVLTLISTVYNTLVFISPGLRNILLRNGGSQKLETLRKLTDISTHTQVGDWMLLYMLSRNLDSLVWSELVMELHLLLKDSNHNTESGADLPAARREAGADLPAARRGRHTSHHSQASRKTSPTIPQ